MCDNNYPKVSIIVVTFNQEDTISRTLESILCQKCNFNYEIIIGEDASQDHTRNICLEYQKKYPDIIRLMPKQSNKGLLDNYMDCLLACRGVYIADCAGDDYWISDTKLQKQADILDSDEHISLVHTDYTCIDEQTGKLIPSTTIHESSLRDSIIDGKTMLRAILDSSTIFPINLCTAMYRKATILSEYYNDTFLFRNPDFGFEDLPISAVLSHAGKIAFLSENTLNYTTGHESISNSFYPSKIFDFYYKSISLHLYLDKKYPEFASQKSSYHKMLQYILAQTFNTLDSKRRTRFKELIKNNHLSLSIKSYLTLFLSSWKPLWKASAYVNKKLNLLYKTILKHQ